MIAYPKQDHEIELLTTDNSSVSGLINVLGRSIATYLQGSEPDIVMYRCRIKEGKEAQALMVSKNATIWVCTGEKPVNERVGNWQRLMFRMANGATVTGDVDMTGYDRVSDYLQNFDDRFYEVYSAETDHGFFELLYLSRVATIWKEPVS